MSDTKQIIEVNGVKLEVDLRHARRIEELRIGSRVKVLDSNGYSGTRVHAGVVVGFEPFPSKPTIIVAYIESAYNDVGLKTLSYNEDTEKFEIVASIDDDFSVSKSEVLGWFRRERQKLDEKRAELDAKETFFLERFKSFWTEGELEEAVA